MKDRKQKDLERIISRSRRVKKKKKSLHDDLIDRLMYRIMNMYSPDIIGRNLEFDIGKQHGEIDLFYIHNFRNRKIGVAIEVKTNRSVKNDNYVVKQLSRDVQWLTKKYGCDEVRTFYATTSKTGKDRAWLYQLHEL